MVWVDAHRVHQVLDDDAPLGWRGFGPHVIEIERCEQVGHLVEALRQFVEVFVLGDDGCLLDP